MHNNQYQIQEIPIIIISQQDNQELKIQKVESINIKDNSLQQNSYSIQAHQNDNKQQEKLNQVHQALQVQDKQVQDKQVQCQQVVDNQGYDYYYDQNDNGKFFNLSQIKPLDLKSSWLGNTQLLLQKFSQKLIKLQSQQQNLQKGFQLFQQNQKRYKINSINDFQKLRNLNFDRKKIYNQFMANSRKPIENINPGLLLNIGTYVQSNLFYFLARIRRVSKVFDFVYRNQQVQDFVSEKQLGQKQPRKVLEKMCKQWLHFQSTFMYYKQIKYTDQIPPNSFKQDLQRAVLFINQIHKRLYCTKNLNFNYLYQLNKFMKKHRLSLALSTLSLTNLIMIRKPSIVAFSNYLALNKQARRKDQITKTKCYQVIKVVEDQDYRDCLLINTKLSNFLEQTHAYGFGIFIIHKLISNTKDQSKNSQFLTYDHTYNVLMFNKTNHSKRKFVRNVPLMKQKINKQLLINQQLTQEQLQQKCKLDSGQQGITIAFKNNLFIDDCQFTYYSGTQLITLSLSKGLLMDCLIQFKEQIQTTNDNIPKMIQQGLQIKFSQCYVYNSEYYYVIVIKNVVDQVDNQNSSLGSQNK